MTSRFKLGSLRVTTAGLALGLSVFSAAYSILYYREELQVISQRADLFFAIDGKVQAAMPRNIVFANTGTTSMAVVDFQIAYVLPQKVEGILLICDQLPPDTLANNPRRAAWIGLACKLQS
ncbi:hypothetical protein G6L29_32045 [Agrobacterium rhizogenes]|uniref:hypothetical protein n=1 Tax=Rhizobium rhizogenes TaxID=359 RepID=UPI00157299DF|nr:hypothetical protein [Rhizobium rhizogenes]NTG91017.1 hypothetical protein [Rhizobium rhizogenes]NTI20290.1 hypothetical protein [Rhizobium rhizogenes]NTI39338.1 hypothetical protein [Rhizobium rhizogenes]WEO68943.1 hypothetical protein G6L54_022215 [Rhizobium rhizogenes]